MIETNFLTFGRRRFFNAVWLIALSYAMQSCSIVTGANPQLEEDFATKFLGKYCMTCHDAGTAEGDRNFEAFKLPIQSEQQLITADEIIDQITLKQMPPEDSEQPSDEQRLKVLETLRTSISKSRSQFDSSSSRTVMRRLSNREYENTLATLFNRRVDTLGLTADFPKEKTSKHMDNIGKSLVTSGFLVDQYFQV